MNKFINALLTTLLIVSATHVKAIVTSPLTTTKDLVQLANETLGGSNKSIGRVYYRDNEKSTCPAAIITSNGALILTDRPKEVEYVEFNDTKYRIIATVEIKKSEPLTLIYCKTDKDFENSSPLQLYNKNSDVIAPYSDALEISQRDQYLIGYGNNYDPLTRQPIAVDEDLLKAVHIYPFYEEGVRDRYAYSLFSIKGITEIEPALLYCLLKGNEEPIKKEPPKKNVAAKKSQKKTDRPPKINVADWINNLDDQDLASMGFEKIKIGNTNYYITKAYSICEIDRDGNVDRLIQGRYEDFGAQEVGSEEKGNKILRLDYIHCINKKFSPIHYLIKKYDLAKLLPNNRPEDLFLTDLNNLEEYHAILYATYQNQLHNNPGSPGPGDVGAFVISSSKKPGAPIYLQSFVCEAGSKDITNLATPFHGGKSKLLRIPPLFSTIHEILAKEIPDGYTSLEELPTLPTTPETARNPTETSTSSQTSLSSSIKLEKFLKDATKNNKGKQPPVFKNGNNVKGNGRRKRKPNQGAPSTTPTPTVEGAGTTEETPDTPKQRPPITMDSALSNNSVLIESQFLLTDLKLEEDKIGGSISIRDEEYQIKNISSNETGITLIELDTPILKLLPIPLYSQTRLKLIPDSLEVSLRGSACAYSDKETRDIRYFVGFGSTEKEVKQLSRKQRQWIYSQIISEACNPK